MRTVLTSARTLLGIARPPASVLPPRPAAQVRDPDHHRHPMAIARDMPDGAPAGEALLDAVAAAVAARRASAGLSDGPPSPRAGGLCIRRHDLPDWWADSGSLMLAAAGVPTPALALGPGVTMPRHALFVVGEGATPPQFNLLGPDALVVIGDRVTLPGTAMSVGDNSTILIGDGSRCTLLVLADIRNGGALIVGRDCLLSSGTSFLSDDTHAIRDLASGRRLNKRGGRILIEDDVLISDRVRIMGDAWIGRGSVVAATAFVKDARFAPGTLAGGRPARVLETGIRWGADDPG